MQYLSLFRPNRIFYFKIGQYKYDKGKINFFLNSTEKWNKKSKITEYLPQKYCYKINRSVDIYLNVCVTFFFISYKKLSNYQMGKIYDMYLLLTLNVIKIKLRFSSFSHWWS
jgi:hypothetical protein